MSRAWTIQLVAFACASTVFILLGSATLVHTLRSARAPRARWAGLGAIAAAMLALHCLWVAPAFVHPEFYGPELVTDLLRFPFHEPIHREYGAGSFAFLRGLSSLFGHSVEGVVRANALYAAACVFPLAALTTRMSGRTSAGIYAALAWASSGLVARIACSEDVHPSLTFVALLAALFIDIAATTGRWPALVAGVAGGILLVISRQTYFSWIPLLFALWLERSRKKTADGPGCSPRIRRMGLAALAVIPLFAGLLVLLRDAGDAQAILLATMLLFMHPAELLSCLSVHPIFDVQRLSICLPMLMLFGGVWIVRRAPARFSWALGAAASFFISIPSNWPSPGNRWGFRMPIVVLAIVAAGVGASWLEERSSRKFILFRRSMMTELVGLAILACGLLASAWRENRMPHPEFQNYVFLRDNVLRLQHTESMGLVLPPEGSEGPRNAASALARLYGLRQATAREALAGNIDPRIHWYFYRDLACFTFSVLELYLDQNVDGKFVDRWLEEDTNRLVTVLFRVHRRFGLDDAPSRGWVERSNCLALTAQSESVGLTGPNLTPIVDPPQSIPMVQQMTPEIRRFVGAQKATVR